MLCLIVGAVVIYLLFILNQYIRKPYSFWKDKNKPYYLNYGPYKDTLNFITNNIDDFAESLQNYNAFPDKKCYGVVSTRLPGLLIKDLEIIKQVIIKDFDHFTDHLSVINEDPILSKNLFTSKGKIWHDMRTILSPVFTGSKMRGMFDLMAVCGDQIVAHFSSEYKKQGNGKPLEIEFKSTSTHYTNDVIATTSFGIQCDSFKYPNNEFIQTGRAIFDFSILRFILCLKVPSLAKLFDIKIMQNKVYEFFPGVIKEALKTRRENNVFRPDMIQLLMEAKESLENQTDENSPKNLVLTDDDIISQAFVFFAAGFETVSVAMSFAVYELTINPDIQKRLQNEIVETFKKCKGKLTYDDLNSMKYLDMVVSETLRKWPPAPTIDRCCTKNYTLNVDGEEFVFEPDMLVFVPTLGIHRDPKYYPNPEKFDPERFSDENKHLIKPLTYMPFGAGPRICIASRFAIMEVKIILCYLLNNFNFEVIKKTPIPLKLKMSGFTYTARDGFWIGLTPRTEELIFRD